MSTVCTHKSGNTAFQIFENFFIIWKNNYKVIPTHISGNPAKFLTHFIKMRPDFSQELVSCHLTIPFVKKLKMFNINGYQTVFPCRSFIYSEKGFCLCKKRNSGK